MKKWVRIFAILIVAVMAIGIGGVAVLVAVDTNEIRDFLSAEVKKATGRDLAIKGDLNLAVSLSPTVIANDVTFANAEWGSSPSMVSLKRLEVGLDLIPLLKGEIDFTNIQLVAPKILLERRADGLGNWQFGPQEISSKPGAAPIIPRLGQVDIRNAIFSFKDQAKGQDFEVTVKQLSLDGEDPSGFLNLKLAGAFSGAPFSGMGRLGQLDLLAADPTAYSVDLSIAAMATQFGIKGNIARPLSAPDFNLAFSAKGDGITATIDAAKAVLAELKLPPVPKIGGFEIAGRLAGGTANPRLEDLKFTLGTHEFFNATGGGKITGLGGAPVIDMRLAVNVSDLRPFSGFAGLDLAKGRGYTLAAALAIKPGGISARDITLFAGASDIKGQVGLSLKGPVPVIQADLTSDILDLKDFLAALPEGKKAAAPNSDSKSAFSDDPLSLAALKLVNGRLKFKGRRVIAGPAPIENVNLAITLSNGNLSAKPVSAQISGGKLDASITLGGSAPNLNAALKLKGLDLGALLKEMQLVDIVSGRLDGTVQLKGSGASVRKIMAGLGGRTEIVMNQGRIESKYVDLIAADLVNAVMPWADHAKDTKINCLVSRFDIKQGIAVSTGLLFDTEKMTITGGGQIDLRSEKLDLQIKPAPKDASLISLSVPINIGGTLKSPSAAPSTAAVLKGVAGLALTAINPLALLALTVSGGEADKNPCIAALDKAASNKTAPAAKPKSDNPIEAISKGVGGALKSLF
jgi:uncharacterized protein involved in outer membrane biogenesis